MSVNFHIYFLFLNWYFLFWVFCGCLAMCVDLLWCGVVFEVYILYAAVLCDFRGWRVVIR
jgi:hypothetical protein